jgi:DNA replication protein
MTFTGFLSSREKLTPIPETFFSELLPEIKHLGEIKIILYAFWFLNQQQEDMQYFSLHELLADKILVASFSPEPENNLTEALEQAVQDHVFIKAAIEEEELYFPNTPRGRAAVKAMRQGNWQPEPEMRQSTELRMERPNIFRLYEENIGPLTPLISELLQDADEGYPTGWIEDAIRIAVEKNVRNWRYIDAILKSWQKEGRSEKDRRNAQEDRRKYIDGEYRDIIEY